MNPKSFLSNFWGSLHFDTPSFSERQRFLFLFPSEAFFIFIMRGGPSYAMGRCAQITKHTAND